MATLMEEKKQEDTLLGHSIDAILKTEDGRRLFVYLFNICGYNRLSVVINPRTGEPSVDSTVYNEARRGVYIQLRRLASPSLLRIAEEAAEAPLATPVKINEDEEKK